MESCKSQTLNKVPIFVYLTCKIWATVYSGHKSWSQGDPVKTGSPVIGSEVTNPI
jgi:hypothetical protein